METAQDLLMPPAHGLPATRHVYSHAGPRDLPPAHGLPAICHVCSHAGPRDLPCDRKAWPLRAARLRLGL